MDGSSKGKVVVVTGASSGIGRELARGAAAGGATVLAISRGEGRGRRVVEELRRSTGNQELRFLPADLSSMAAVRSVAERVRGAVDRVDVLLNNAGAYFARRRITVDGYEASFALNHLAPFLLTQLLLEALAGAGRARVVITASEASRAARLHLDDPMLERRYSGWAAYGQSKLANLAFTTALARRLQGTGVTVNAFHPGFVDSGFGSGRTISNRLLGLAAGLFGRTPERGADTGTYLAFSPDVAQVSGGYFANRKRIVVKAPARDPATSERLWRLSEELVGLSGVERQVFERVRVARAGPPPR